MGLDIVLQVRPRIKLDIIREIVTHNQKAYRYRHAKRALNHYVKSYALFVGALRGMYYDEEDEQHAYLHVSKLYTTAFISGQSLAIGEESMVYGKEQETFDLREVYEHIHEELQTYVDAEETA